MKKSNILTFLFLFFFILINLVAYLHSYKFTHFSDNLQQRTQKPTSLSTSQKIKAILFGVENPKPRIQSYPSIPFETITLNNGNLLECWHIKTENSKGTVILFHGYAASKSSLIVISDIFLQLGYNTFLVDFRTCGNSSGNETTIGYKEAEDVLAAFNFIKSKDQKEIILFGQSMGAVSIMKAINDYQIKPNKIILESPFGDMLTTTKARFKQMNIPSFPMAELLVFWGGSQNGYNGFIHNPIEYAKRISQPTLLLHADKDLNVSKVEIDAIYSNLKGKKFVANFANIGHNEIFKKNIIYAIDILKSFTN